MDETHSSFSSSIEGRELSQSIAHLQTQLEEMSYRVTAIAGSLDMMMFEQEWQRTGEGSDSIRQAMQEFHEWMVHHEEQLNRASLQWLTRLEQVVCDWPDFMAHQLSHNLSQHMDQTAEQLFQKSVEVSRWHYARYFGWVLLSSLIISTGIGMYFFNEKPWEIHSHVVQERNLGKAALESWNHLSESDRQLLSDLSQSHRPR